MDKTSQQLGVVSTSSLADLGRTLILLGHGSHLNGDSAQAVRAHAEAARRLGLFEEVLVGFWKEEPSLRGLLRLARYRDVTVVPLFVSEGYFTGTVIPRELGLNWRGPVPAEGLSVRLGEQQVHYTRPYGIHPEMVRVILARAAEVRPDWSPTTTALIVLGHGTGRDARSRQATEQAADRLRGSGQFAEVQALYLDQEPRVEHWASLTHSPDVVIVPFFASEGWHTQETIPHDLGLTGAVTTFGDVPGAPRRVYYSRPVGTHPAVSDVVSRLVAGFSEQLPASTDPASMNPVSTDPASMNTSNVDPDWQQAGEALLRAVASGLTVGEVQVTRLPDGSFDLRHREDVGRLALRFVAPGDLAAWTGRSDTGAHRPIRTQRTLPRGWHTAADPEDLRAALHAVYPAATEEAHAWQQGTLPLTSWPETAARQSGMYAPVKQASSEQVAQARARICAPCLRVPLWAGESLSATFLSGHAEGFACAEACTLLVSEVREVMQEETAYS